MNKMKIGNETIYTSLFSLHIDIMEWDEIKTIETEPLTLEQLGKELETVQGMKGYIMHRVVKLC